MAASLPTPLCPEWTARGHGTVVITKHYKLDGRTVDYITVDRADPEILIDDVLLSELERVVEQPRVIIAVWIVGLRDRPRRCSRLTG